MSENPTTEAPSGGPGTDSANQPAAKPVTRDEPAARFAVYDEDERRFVGPVYAKRSEAAKVKSAKGHKLTVQEV